jgi:hypothetical protein
MALWEEYNNNTDINNPMHSLDAPLATSPKFENRVPPEGFRHTTGSYWKEERKGLPNPAGGSTR